LDTEIVEVSEPDQNIKSLAAGMQPLKVVAIVVFMMPYNITIIKTVHLAKSKLFAANKKWFLNVIL